MEFGAHIVPLNNIIYRTKYTYVFTNLMPSIEGHILVASIRRIPYLHELTTEEKSDFFKVVDFAGHVMKKHLKKKELTLTIQDGPSAGQTVPHVHCHVVPKNKSAVFLRTFPDEETRKNTTTKYIEYFKQELKDH